jgi:hypothetical protein
MRNVAWACAATLCWTGAFVACSSSDTLPMEPGEQAGSRHMVVDWVKYEPLQ